jgi:hypothetical protein
MTKFYSIFTDWENQQKEGWETPFPKDPFVGHDRPEYNLFSDSGKKKYVERLHADGLTTPGVKIKAVAVWDTVGMWTARVGCRAGLTICRITGSSSTGHIQSAQSRIA